MRNSCLFLAMSLAVSGCAVAPPPPRLLAAADSRARPSPKPALDASAGTLAFRPVSPSGWGAPTPPDEKAIAKGAKP